MANRKSQLEKISRFLQNSGKNLTVAEARRRFGVQRLAARIYDLRQNGFEIRTNDVRSGHVVTSYTLVD